jgi:hypothetical protein
MRQRVTERAGRKTRDKHALMRAGFTLLMPSERHGIRQRASTRRASFRRDDIAKPQRMRSRSNGNEAKSTTLIDILPLITVWLRVRVSGPSTEKLLLVGRRSDGVLAMLMRALGPAAPQHAK